jgi:phage gpG-like protein
MAGYIFDITIDPTQADRFLGALSLQLQPKLMNQEIAKGLEAMIHQSFERESDPSGRPWPPVSAAYLKRLQVLGKANTKLLQRTGAGKLSIAVVASSNVVKVVVGKDYMTYHNTGTRTLPKRPFIPTAKEAEPAIKAIATGYLSLMIAQFVGREVTRTSDFVRRLLG